MTMLYYIGYDGIEYSYEIPDPRPPFIATTSHEPYPKSLGCLCALCEQGRKEEMMTPDDILRAVAHIQDGHQLIEPTASKCWYETTDAPIPYVNPDAMSDYLADSFIAGWDMYAYASGNPDADAVSPDTLDIDEYSAGLFAAWEATNET